LQGIGPLCPIKLRLTLGLVGHGFAGGDEHPGPSCKPVERRRTGSNKLVSVAERRELVLISDELSERSFSFCRWVGSRDRFELMAAC
jgi:hypothetical protein